MVGWPCDNNVLVMCVIFVVLFYSQVWDDGETFKHTFLERLWNYGIGSRKRGQF